jgi:hypothetical protein
MANDPQADGTEAEAELRSLTPGPRYAISVRYEMATLPWMTRLPLDLPPGRPCRRCGAPVDRRNRHGRAPSYCSDACRQAAYRRRERGLPEDLPRQAREGRRRVLVPR